MATKTKKPNLGTPIAESMTGEVHDIYVDLKTFDYPCLNYRVQTELEDGLVFVGQQFHENKVQKEGSPNIGKTMQEVLFEDAEFRHADKLARNEQITLYGIQKWDIGEKVRLINVTRLPDEKQPEDGSTVYYRADSIWFDKNGNSERPLATTDGKRW